LQRLKDDRASLVNEKLKAEDNARRLTILLEERAHQSDESEEKHFGLRRELTERFNQVMAQQLENQRLRGDLTLT
jgi:hypothetical protein